jgi:hypothetical protein
MPADFPYMTNPATLRRFLDKVQSLGVPKKVTISYLASLGFKSTNDRPIIPALKFLSFLGSSAEPTETWKNYRHKASAGAVLATSIRSAYSELFDTYPDAERKDTEALRNFFSTHTTVGEATLNMIVRTFKTVCEAADFSSDAPPSPDSPEETKDATADDNNSKGRSAFPLGKQVLSGPAININIQLQLQATEDAKVYDSFFAAMKKHLFPGE